MRHHRAADEIGRDQIDFDDAPPHLGLKLPERRVAPGDAGIVDQNIDLAGFTQQRIDGSADGRLIGDVDSRGVDAATTFERRSGT